MKPEKKAAKFFNDRGMKIIAVGIILFLDGIFFFTYFRVISFCRNDEYFPLFINMHTNKLTSSSSKCTTNYGSKNKLCYYGWHTKTSLYRSELC